jgi:hypothetical protein
VVQFENMKKTFHVLLIVCLLSINAQYVSASADSSGMNDQEKQVLIRELLRQIRHLQAQLLIQQTPQKEQHQFSDKNMKQLRFTYLAPRVIPYEIFTHNQNTGTKMVQFSEKISIEEMLRLKRDHESSGAFSVEIGDSKNYFSVSTQIGNYLEFIDSKYGKPAKVVEGDIESYSVYYIGDFHVIEINKRDSHGTEAGEFIVTEVDYMETASYVKLHLFWGGMISTGEGSTKMNAPLYYGSRQEAFDSLLVILDTLKY